MGRPHFAQVPSGIRRGQAPLRNSCRVGLVRRRCRGVAVVRPMYVPASPERAGAACACGWHATVEAGAKRQGCWIACSCGCWVVIDENLVIGPDNLLSGRSVSGSDSRVSAAWSPSDLMAPAVDGAEAIATGQCLALTPVATPGSTSPPRPLGLVRPARADRGHRLRRGDPRRRCRVRRAQSARGRTSSSSSGSTGTKPERR
jgi:hypothetical protein